MREWQRGKIPSPLFSVFGVLNHLFKVDWLHCADQGVAPDFLGNLFAYLVKHKMPGPNEDERCKALGAEVFDFYEQNDVEDRLKEFEVKTYSSSKKTTKPPKLKGSAAECRALVPFGLIAAQRHLRDDDAFEKAMKSAASHLKNCYDGLRAGNRACSHDAFYESSKAFALQYRALYRACGNGVSWRPMPKMHMFLELCSSRTELEKFRNYRDEDFGGSVSRQSRMKGSWKLLGTYARHSLDLFRCKNQAPRIVRRTIDKKTKPLHASTHTHTLSTCILNEGEFPHIHG